MDDPIAQRYVALENGDEAGAGENEKTIPGTMPQPHIRYAAQYDKYSVRLHDIRVRKAVSEGDFQIVEKLRAAGFARVAGKHRPS